MADPERRQPIQDVNITLGDDVSRMLYEASRLTQANRPGLLTEFHESFSGARAINIGQFPDVSKLMMNLGFDGVGTKVEIAERNRDHSTVAYDLFAMVCDDAVVRGAEPIALGSILDVRQLDDNHITHTAVRQLAEGYVGAAQEAGVVVVNGEVAELGDRVGGHGPFNYNWGATALWLAHPDRLLTGYDIKPGDALIGLAEHGFRSNGITDVRKAMLKWKGEQWQDVVDPDISTEPLGKVVGRPSQIYTKFITDLTGGYDITREPKAKISGVAHITGGGQPSKLGRMLAPTGLGAVIADPIDPPEIMRVTQIVRNLTDEQAYSKWHMGPGMIIAAPESETGTIVTLAHQAGIDAQRIGEVVESPYGTIQIRNRGAVGVRDYLRFSGESQNS